MSRFSKTTLLTGSATAALIASHPLGDPAQAQTPGSIYNWSGFYVGVHGGAAWTDEGGGSPGECGPFSNFLGEGGTPLADEFEEGGFDCFPGFIDDLDSPNEGLTFPSFELSDDYVAWTDYDRSDSNTRGIFGSHLGYNIQAGRMVYGMEADFSGVWGDGGEERVGFEYFFDGDSDCPGVGCDLFEYAGTGTVRRKTDLDWLSTLRARVGATFAADRLLVYATGGLAIAGTSTSISTDFDTTGGVGGCSDCTFSGGDDDSGDAEFGLAVGAGAAFALTPNVSLGLEYLFAHFGGGGGDDEVTFNGNGGRAFDVDFEDSGIDDLHLVRARITYRFGGP